MSKVAKRPVFPGFEPLSEQVFVREGEIPQDEKPPSGHPRAVIIFSWGDAIPKHILKYTEGFAKLFPYAKQIAVLSPIFQAMRQNIDQRTKNMLPVLEAAFPHGTDYVTDNAVLMHVMSNTGGINYAATLNAYKEKYGQPLPHRLTSYDSTPGGLDFTWENLSRWSYAMALGTAGWFPWPFVITQSIWGVFLCVNRVVDHVSSTETAPQFGVRAMLDPAFTSHQATKLYLYSKEDKLISSVHIEENMAESKQGGYKIEGKIFEGSAHVGHMRMFPEEYWGAIEKAWNNTEQS